LSSISDAQIEALTEIQFANKCTAFLGLHTLNSPTRFREDPYFYKGRPTTPSAPALDDRTALALWQRSAALAGMKE